MDLEEKLNAIRNRDKKYRGRFFVAVKTTRIVCTPDCPAKPLEKNIMVYDTLEEALQAGYRPCKICMKDMNIRKKEHYHDTSIQLAVRSAYARLVRRQTLLMRLAG